MEVSKPGPPPATRAPPAAHPATVTRPVTVTPRHGHARHGHAPSPSRPVTVTLRHRHAPSPQVLRWLDLLLDSDALMREMNPYRHYIRPGEYRYVVLQVRNA